MTSAIKIHWTEWAFTSKCDEAQYFYEMFYTALCSEVNYSNIVDNSELTTELCFNLQSSGLHANSSHILHSKKSCLDVLSKPGSYIVARNSEKVMAVFEAFQDGILVAV